MLPGTVCTPSALPERGSVWAGHWLLPSPAPASWGQCVLAHFWSFRCPPRLSPLQDSLCDHVRRISCDCGWTLTVTRTGRSWGTCRLGTGAFVCRPGCGQGGGECWPRGCEVLGHPWYVEIQACTASAETTEGPCLSRSHWQDSPRRWVAFSHVSLLLNLFFFLIIFNGSVRKWF